MSSVSAHVCIEKKSWGCRVVIMCLKYGGGMDGWMGVDGHMWEFIGGKDFVGLIGHIFSAFKCKGTWYLNYTLCGLRRRLLTTFTYPFPFCTLNTFRGSGTRYIQSKGR